MALLLICAAMPARADCPAAPIGDPDDMAISFLKANGAQLAPSSLLPSSVKKGMLVYDDNANRLKLCDGMNWIEVGTGSGADTLASLSCTSGQVAKFNGATWACAGDDGGATAAGSAGEIQFNNGSNGFAADAGFHWDNTSKVLSILDGEIYIQGAAFGATGNALSVVALDGNYGIDVSGGGGNAINVTNGGDFSYGVNASTNGSYSRGVAGNSAGANGIGVYGVATGTDAYGVHGLANNASGRGVYGMAYYGVYGAAGPSNGYGVFGTSPSGYGVWGQASATS